ncbi:MAG: tetratricopeptide repeat protein [Bacteroidaceae bacterium]|nr:tetratricopeptide repeat protein [Bacteroidaceae bacterium]MBP3834016.1 tetratricopeptide repeat protein [Bacteroidaceae bacterium]
MKKYLCLLVLLMAIACQHHYQYPLVLQEADSLCVAKPDSAIALLKSISTEMLQAPEYVQKRYQLLTIKANDKAYITHTSDSLILSLVDYYEHGGDPVYLGETYYYAGRTYSDLGDAPRALEYFQKALDAMPGDENLKVKSKVYAQMGDLFRKQKLYRQAIESFQQSYKCDIIRKDTLGMIYNLRDIGFAYRGLDKPDSTLVLLNEAHKLSLMINNQQMDNRITSQMASLYIQLGDLEKAKIYIQPSLEKTERSNLSSIYSIAGDIYYQLGQIDSAAYYYKQLLDKGTIYAQRTANERLASISLNEWHDAKQTLDFSERFLQLQDSINHITSTESVSLRDALYNYNLRERDNSRLLIKQKNYQIILAIGILVFLMMAAGISLHVIRNKHKRQLLQSELQKEQAKNYYFEDYIAQREEIIRQMEDEAETMDSENNDLKVEIARQRQLLEDYTRSAQQTKELAFLIPGDVKASPVYGMLQEYIFDGKHLKDDNITQVINMMKTYQPLFVNHLLSLTQLSQQELLICILSKLDIPNKNIASLLTKSESTISSTRIRIYEKMMKTKGNTKDFNDLIHSL